MPLVVVALSISVIPAEIGDLGVLTTHETPSVEITTWPNRFVMLDQPAPGECRHEYMFVSGLLISPLMITGLSEIAVCLISRFTPKTLSLRAGLQTKAVEPVV